MCIMKICANMFFMDRENGDEIMLPDYSLPSQSSENSEQEEGTKNKDEIEGPA